MPTQPESDAHEESRRCRVRRGHVRLLRHGTSVAGRPVLRAQVPDRERRRLPSVPCACPCVLLWFPRVKGGGRFLGCRLVTGQPRTPGHPSTLPPATRPATRAT